MPTHPPQQGVQPNKGDDGLQNAVGFSCRHCLCDGDTACIAHCLPSIDSISSSTYLQCGRRLCGEPTGGWGRRRRRRDYRDPHQTYRSWQTTECSVERCAFHTRLYRKSSFEEKEHASCVFCARSLDKQPFRTKRNIATRGTPEAEARGWCIQRHKRRRHHPGIETVDNWHSASKCAPLPLPHSPTILPSPCAAENLPRLSFLSLAFPQSSLTTALNCAVVAGEWVMHPGSSGSLRGLSLVLKTVHDPFYPETRGVLPLPFAPAPRALD